MKYFKVVNPEPEHTILKDRIFKLIQKNNNLVEGSMLKFPHYNYVFFLEEIIEVDDDQALLEEI